MLPFQLDSSLIDLAAGPKPARSISWIGKPIHMLHSHSCFIVCCQSERQTGCLSFKTAQKQPLQHLVSQLMLMPNWVFTDRGLNNQLEQAASDTPSCLRFDSCKLIVGIKIDAHSLRVDDSIVCMRNEWGQCRASMKSCWEKLCLTLSPTQTCFAARWVFHALDLSVTA